MGEEAESVVVSLKCSVLFVHVRNALSRIVMEIMVKIFSRGKGQPKQERRMISYF